MKIIALFLAIATSLLAVVCTVQSRKLAARQEQVRSLTRENEQKSQQLESAQASEQHAQAQAQDLLRQTAELSAQNRVRRQAEEKALAALASRTNQPSTAAEPGQPGESKGGFGNFISKMMQDPDAKKFIRDQQRMMMDQLYAPLVKQMGLTPQEADKFKDLLADNMVKGAEKASSLFGGTNRSERLETLTAEQRNFEDELKAYLGDARYALYKDYQTTVGERTQLNLFKQQTAGGENPLSDQQTEQLLAIMKEEKQAVAAASGLPLPGAGQDAANLEAMISGGQMDTFLQAQETTNQRVYQRAQEILSPEQMAAFATFQTNQMQMMRMGMTMARKMFGSDKAASDNPRQ